MRISHSHELCSLTKHLFCACTHTHTRTDAYGAPWSSPKTPTSSAPHLEKVSGFFDVSPIDHHYYCSLLIPMEMRPAATVLGDWGWGQGLPPPGFPSEYKIQLTAAYCSACWVRSEGHAGTYTRGMDAHQTDYTCTARTLGQGGVFADWCWYDGTGPSHKITDPVYAVIYDGPLPKFMTIHEFSTAYSWIRVPPVGHCHKLFFFLNAVTALGFIWNKIVLCSQNFLCSCRKFKTATTLYSQ